MTLLSPSMTDIPFPDDVPTHTLSVVDYALIQAGDSAEIENLWNAATQQGFWYMKNHALSSSLISSMFDMGYESLAMLPLDEKMKYWQGNSGGSAGYKAVGATTVSPDGQKDFSEMINVGTNHALAYDSGVDLSKQYPPALLNYMPSTVKPYIRGCTDMSSTILRIFEEKLGLPQGSLVTKHPEVVDPEDQESVQNTGSEARIVRVPKVERKVDAVIGVGSHTDFGSLSFLANTLGGLQVLLPGDQTWKYVKPLKNHIICNVGDALHIFSGGILQSSTHRVVPPPPPQDEADRYSLVYFTRPGDDIVLRALDTLSPSIASNLSKRPDGTSERFVGNVTAREWFVRRQAMWRKPKQNGLEDYLASRGTEHTITSV